MTRFVAAALAGLTIACGGTPESPAAPSVSFSTFQSAHFSFRHTAIDASTIVQTASLIEREYARILDDLGVAQMPTVVVTLYPDNDSLRKAVTPIVGAIPSFATGLITSVDAIHILSPNLRATWTYNDGVASTVHEFAHCVSVRVNPSIANNPRWLWETVALFESRQYNDGEALTRATAGPLPTFAQLNSFDNTIVYGVGAWIGFFIVETRGFDALRALVRDNGDLSRTLGTTESAFLSEWAAFVRGTIASR